MSFCSNLWERRVKELRRAEKRPRYVPLTPATARPTPPPASRFGTFGTGGGVPR